MHSTYLIVEVLAWIRGLVFESLDEAVKHYSQQGPENGTDLMGASQTMARVESSFDSPNISSGSLGTHARLRKVQTNELG